MGQIRAFLLFVVLCHSVGAPFAQAAGVLIVPTSQPGLELTYTKAEFNNAWYADRTLPTYLPGRVFIATASAAGGHSQESVQTYLRAKLAEKFGDRIANVSRVTDDKILEKEEFKGKELYEISEFFPPTVLLHLGVPEGADPRTGEAPNCFGAAIAFHDGQEIKYADSGKFLQFTRQFVSVPATEAPQFGEMIYMRDVEHAAVYLFDDIIFQKPSVGIYNSYEIVPYSKMFKTLNDTLIVARRFRAGTYHDSPWDRFLFGASSLPDLAPPKPLQSGTWDIARYRPKTCQEQLVVP